MEKDKQFIPSDMSGGKDKTKVSENKGFGAEQKSVSGEKNQNAPDVLAGKSVKEGQSIINKIAGHGQFRPK